MFGPVSVLLDSSSSVWEMVLASKGGGKEEESLRKRPHIC